MTDQKESTSPPTPEDTRAAERLFLRQFAYEHTYDHQVAVGQLMSLAHRVAKVNGFYDSYAGNAAQLCNIHEEVSEAIVAYREEEGLDPTFGSDDMELWKQQEGRDNA